MTSPLDSSGIRDNHHRGTVADFLSSKIANGSNLSIVSAYFTIYAYEALRQTLDKIEHLNFLFGEPSFIDSNRDRQELKQWFTELWNNKLLVKDVKEDVLVPNPAPRIITHQSPSPVATSHPAAPIHEP